MAAYNQPLTPEDAIMTPSGGFVDRRWLLDSGGMTSEATTEVAAGSSKPRSSRRLWKTVLKRCKKFGGSKGKAAAAAPWPAPPPPPRSGLPDGKI